MNPDILMKSFDANGSHVHHIHAISSRNRDEFFELLTKNQVRFGFYYPQATRQQLSHENKVSMIFTLSNLELLPSNTASISKSPGMAESGIYRIINIVNSSAIGM